MRTPRLGLLNFNLARLPAAAPWARCGGRQLAPSMAGDAESVVIGDEDGMLGSTTTGDVANGPSASAILRMRLTLGPDLQNDRRLRLAPSLGADLDGACADGCAPW